MKKILLLILTLFSLIISSCSSDDSENDDTIQLTVAEIKVLDSFQLSSGVAVHMFKDNKGPSTNFFKPIFSNKTVVTELNGVAKFKLEDVFDLNAIDKQTTLYFGVFDTEEKVLGFTALTIEKGQTKTATINY